MAEGTLRVGTSGWVYSHWKGNFYPDDLPQDRWFEHYAERFDTVEINNTFYHLPPDKDFDSWSEQAPPNFLYAVKGSRYITHMKKLKNPEDAVGKFVSGARRLKKHLGPILWQLPPNWHANPDRLERFARRIPDDLAHAFEFRDPDWFNEEVKAVLQERGHNFVIFALPELECPHWVTADPVYLRFHGSLEKYVGRYGEDGLKPWMERIQAWREEGYDVVAYFNNDEKANAVKDAHTLLDLLSSHG